MKNHSHTRISELRLLDPDLANRVETGLKAANQALSFSTQAMIIHAIIKGLAQETTFGGAIADGFLNLIQHGAIKELARFQELVDTAGQKGPAFGWMMATSATPVLRYGDKSLLHQLLTTLDVMGKKGTYTFAKPLKGFQQLMDNDERDCAAAYLDLLCTTFSRELTYNQSLHYTYTLPKAVLAMTPRQRSWQIQSLTHVMSVDIRLADAFLKGLPKGLYLLSKKRLGDFVAAGLRIYHQNKDRGVKYFGLDSKLGMDALANLQVAVALTQLQSQMNRYLHARTGLPITVRSLSRLPKRLVDSDNDAVTVCSDGKHIYLPDQIHRGGHKIDNQDLYHCLLRFESGYYEFGTYDFDLDKWRRQHSDQGGRYAGLNSAVARSTESNPSTSDLDRFFKGFPNADMAKDLFTIMEHGRIRHHYAIQYPGLLRHYLPILQHEACRITKDDGQKGVLAGLYQAIALGMSLEASDGLSSAQIVALDAMVAECRSRLQADATVDVSIGLVAAFYQTIDGFLTQSPAYDGHYCSPNFPFGRKIRPDLVHAAHIDVENLAAVLQNKLLQHRIQVFRSDIKQMIRHSRGVMTQEDLDWITRQTRDMETNAPVAVERIETIFATISDNEPQFIGLVPAIAGGGNGDSVSWYWEWDNRTEDYLHDHVRVVDREVPPLADAFYEQVLEQYDGLVAQIKSAFEMMKPAGLKRLRQWVEGDEFDYRALVDHVVDRWVGQMPSDRLYIKKIKHRRDVSALLLVDLSRSTANSVTGSATTVLQVEKEAIVLFAEALQVVGDDFAIAGYSGTGRLGVDFFHIKEFGDSMSDSVKQRINAMTPQRNTRMGAAIRHAAKQFERVDSSVRLLILLGDGFPNDTEYKQGYAIRDTYKAISELRNADIHVHAITVNIDMKDSDQLDPVFGHVHHTCITDITELPDKLLRIYSSLTRN